jgi:hypothetical protein
MGLQGMREDAQGEEKGGGGVTCPCCASPRPLSPTIIGIQRGLDEIPALILWNCPCGSTRATRWADATRAQRVEAFLADLARDEGNEMTMGRG